MEGKVGSCLVAGGGTAGLLAAITLRIKCPHIKVSLVRSKALGVIGVGEGTYYGINPFLFKYLQLSRETFYQQANPTWKLGIKFNWGDSFNYTFRPTYSKVTGNQAYPNGFYYRQDYSHIDLSSSLMDANKVFVRDTSGKLVVPENAVYHLENEQFVAYLEQQAENHQVHLIDDLINTIETDDAGISALVLAKHGKISADLYIDSTGFSSLLLGKNLDVPFESFKSTLFCNRAVVGGWKRHDEPIRPYTTSDAMSAGWAWRIDHEHAINCGYVYSSDFISDDAAQDEFLRKNPKIKSTKVIKFQPGLRQRAWYKNVIAIGNAYGFVEPLEATSIGLISNQARVLVDCLKACFFKPDEFIQSHYNKRIARQWREVRYFLGLHYFLNQKSQGEFWDTCRQETDLGGVSEIVDIYRRYGPDLKLMEPYIDRYNIFGLNGFLTMFLGFRTPCGIDVNFCPEDWKQWKKHVAANQLQTKCFGVSSEEALDVIRKPTWQWEALD